MNKLFVGIDTSNYTTSLALCTYEGEIVANIKQILDVDDGKRGLRQSDALFAHTKNLPTLTDRLSDVIDSYPDAEICAVGYSAYPRDVEGSYMPCFLAGRACAHSFASGRGCSVYKFSHQAGHIQAALYSSGCEEEILSQAYECGGKFAAFHVSGGTTEILLVDTSDGKMNISLIGGTRDINAGQAIDRAGVMMGMKFPCGREMEAVSTAHQNPVKICVNGLYCNLSGLENQSQRIFEKNHDVGEVSAFVFDFVGRTLFKLTQNLREIYPSIPVLYAGGVMSNGAIKTVLSGERAYFAKPEFSSDNAAGIALLCRKIYIN